MPDSLPLLGILATLVGVAAMTVVVPRVFDGILRFGKQARTQLAPLIAKRKSRTPYGGCSPEPPLTSTACPEMGG